MAAVCSGFSGKAKLAKGKQLYVSPLPALRYGARDMTETVETVAEQLTIEDVRAAAARIKGAVVRTDCDYSRTPGRAQHDCPRARDRRASCCLIR